jgi:hypothetical protein
VTTVDNSPRDCFIVDTEIKPMRLRLLLVASLSVRASGQITRTCSVVRQEIEDIFVEDVVGAARNLRGRHVDYTTAFVKVDISQRMMAMRPQSDDKTGNSTTLDIVPFKGLYCDCTSRLPTTDKFYCPAKSTSCEVWSGYISDEYRVSCTNENWMVSYSR